MKIDCCVLKLMRRRGFHRLIPLIAFLSLTVAAVLSPLSAQSVNDVLGILKDTNVKSMVTGWLTEALTQTLTKSSGAMPGDQRLANGGRGLALTRDEQQRANQAAALFAQVQADSPEHPAAVEVAGADAAHDRIFLEKLTRVVAKYDKLPTLTALQQAEIEQALQPFILHYLIEKGQNAGLGAVVVPPRAVESYTFGGYCSDPHLPAPKRGEQFQLVSTSTLYPDSLRPALQGLLRIGAQRGHGHDSAIQGLIWTLRRVANGEALGKSLTLSNEQQQLLTQADPNAIGALQSYYAKAQGQRLMQDAIRSGVGKLSNALSGNQAFSPISHSQALSEIAALTRQLEDAPVSGSVQGQNAAYTLLNNNVAALATTVGGGLESINVDVANASDKAAVFYPGSCVAQSTRPAQRLVMQMVGGQSGAAAMVWPPAQPDRVSLWTSVGMEEQRDDYAQYTPLLYQRYSPMPSRPDKSWSPHAPYLYRTQFQVLPIIERSIVAGGAIISFCRSRPQICQRIGIAVEDLTLTSPLRPRDQLLNDQIERSVAFCAAPARQEDELDRPILVHRLFGGTSREFSAMDATEGTFFALDDPRKLRTKSRVRDIYVLMPEWGNDLSMYMNGYVKKSDITEERTSRTRVDFLTNHPYSGGAIELRIVNARTKVHVTHNPAPSGLIE